MNERTDDDEQEEMGMVTEGSERGRRRRDYISSIYNDDGNLI